MTQLITKEYQGMPFVFREDGYFNMTKAAQAFGKQLNNFWKSPDTAEYVRILEETHSIPMSIATMGRNGGTWAHPKLAIRFAQWLDVRFSVWCDSIIEDILTKKAELTITQPETSATVQVTQSINHGFMLALPPGRIGGKGNVVTTCGKSPKPQNEKALIIQGFITRCSIWRRRRDSNPRCRFMPACSLSRGVPSTSRPRLR